MYKNKLRDGEFSSYRLYFFSKRYLTNWDFETSSDHKIIKYKLSSSVWASLSMGEFTVKTFSTEPCSKTRACGLTGFPDTINPMKQSVKGFSVASYSEPNCKQRMLFT